MNATWRIVRRSLSDLLRRPAARLRYEDMREATPALRQWQAARQVASFLSRRTARADQRKEVLRELLRIVAARGPRAELAATILLLAGTLAIHRIGGRPDGSSPPPLPIVLIIAQAPARKELPRAAGHVPLLAALVPASRTLALAAVSR